MSNLRISNFMIEPIDTIALFKSPQNSKSFAAGEIIFNDGDVGSVMYGILSGDVEFIVNGKVVETLHTGDLFGEGALVHDDHLRASTAIAKTDCQLAVIDRFQFLFLVENTPLFALHVMRSYSDRLRAMKQVG